MAVDIIPLLESNSLSAGCNSYINKTSKGNVNLNGIIINGKIRLIKKIGAGTYGLIYLVEDIILERLYAAKIILKDHDMTFYSTKDTKLRKEILMKRIYDYLILHRNVIATEIDLDYIKNEGKSIPHFKEIALHLKVHDHKNIVTIHKVFTLDNLAVITLMDYYEQGDLFHNILDNQIFVHPPPYQNKNILMKNTMLQLVDAVKYCHSKGVYHCDLKPENVMVKYNVRYERLNYKTIIDYNEIQIAIIDFGLAIDSDIICCNDCRGSRFYMAPERVTNFKTHSIWYFVDLSQYKSIPNKHGNNEMYFPTEAGDKWSLGVLLINITCSMNPWTIASPSTKSGNSVFRTYLYHNKFILQTILPISYSFNNLLNSIFKIDPNDRIDLDKLQEKIVTTDFFYNRPTAHNNLNSPPHSAIETNTSEESNISH